MITWEMPSSDRNILEQYVSLSRPTPEFDETNKT